MALSIVAATCQEMSPFARKCFFLGIREHLIKNLRIDEEDFDVTPLLQDRGGRAKARRILADLGPLVVQLNEAVAA
jgi:hypothetical protein